MPARLTICWTSAGCVSSSDAKAVASRARTAWRNSAVTLADAEGEAADALDDAEADADELDDADDDTADTDETAEEEAEDTAEETSDTA